MKIPRYWARGTQTVQDAQGKSVTFSCWYWSDESLADAGQKAQTRAAKLAWKLASGDRLERYGYGIRPLREEIHKGISDKQHRELAIVTRNGYGALILNAAHTMFIDIDFEPEKRSGLLGVIRRLFGQVTESQQEQHMQVIEQWSAMHPQMGLRVYRTYGGLRCLITNQVFDPMQESALEIMRALACDPLYLTLCQSQECFRARLTPKPWRCGTSNPPSRYPWENSEDERIHRQWEQGYTQTASEFAVCRLVKHLGSHQVHPDVEPVMAFHDRIACSGSDLELA